jgi:cystathionine beta-lyase
VAVVADEVHGDLALPHRRWTPFAAVAGTTRWASLHGPIKTFGLAGVCDTLLVSPDDAIVAGFAGMSARLHLSRNNVFGLAAFEAAYREGGAWLDDLLALVAGNLATLRDGLPDGVRLVEPEGTYLAWLDLRDLGIDPPRLGAWLADQAGIAVSPGHWFGREGAGFARLTMAVPPAWIDRAVAGLGQAVGGLARPSTT